MSASYVSNVKFLMISNASVHPCVNQVPVNWYVDIISLQMMNQKMKVEFEAIESAEHNGSLQVDSLHYHPFE